MEAHKTNRIKELKLAGVRGGQRALEESRTQEGVSSIDKVGVWPWEGAAEWHGKAFGNGGGHRAAKSVMQQVFSEFI